jgi:hypothetical protein
MRAAMAGAAALDRPSWQPGVCCGMCGAAVALAAALACRGFSCRDAESMHAQGKGEPDPRSTRRKPAHPRRLRSRSRPQLQLVRKIRATLPSAPPRPPWRARSTAAASAAAPQPPQPPCPVRFNAAHSAAHGQVSSPRACPTLSRLPSGARLRPAGGPCPTVKRHAPCRTGTRCGCACGRSSTGGQPGRQRPGAAGGGRVLAAGQRAPLG